MRVHAVAVVFAVAAILGSGLVVARWVDASIGQLVLATTAARLQANAAEQVLSALQDAETGQRGYLLTQRANYLQPYYQGVGHAGAALARLQRLSKDEPWLEAETARLTDAARMKLAELARAVEVAQTQGPAAAMDLVLTDAGQSDMDGARASVARIVDRAEAERSQRASLLQSRQQAMSAIVLMALGAGVLLLGLAALALLWNRAQLLRAQLGQRREAARLQSAVEHVRDGVAVFGADDRLRLHNSRFMPLMGLPEALASPGMPWDRLAAEAELDPPLLSGRRPFARPMVAEARQGARTLEVWRSAMPDGGQMLAVADITRRVAAEEVARQAQKMEVLGQMTGGVAHDFNNLLQVVSANLELAANRLNRAGAPDPALLSRLEAASAGVARGARLTRHLLAFARRQPLAPEPLDAARVLMSMEDMLRRTVGEAVKLELVAGGGLWSMRADPNQVENALLNLALNARDAMTGADGAAVGRLTIEAANAVLDEEYAARNAEVSPGQYVMIAVTDTGAGMGPEQLARATEPFYTTKPDGRGTGLGLPMVFGFAKQSGGHFQLHSEPGQGATARLYIPRTTSAAHVAEAAREGPRLGQGELVLLVEDDPAVRLAAAESLRLLGYTVQEAGDADAALRLLEGGTRPAVLFTDVVMPGQVASRDLAARARALAPDIAVLFTSGYTQNSIVHNGQLDEGISLISKPWRTEDLARAIRAVLDAAQAPKPAAPRLRVLLVEDELLVRMATADALAEMGYDVVEAGAGEAALARLEPPPDLLVTGIGLPDTDGLDLVAQIRARVPGLAVVVATGRPEISAPGVVWLAKPYDARRLRAAVEQALAR